MYPFVNGGLRSQGSILWRIVSVSDDKRRVNDAAS